jgi:hypothetical protein
MPTFDQLPAEQRAIIELVVQRGRSYDQLADALQITPERVRELAVDALVELSPRTAERVDEDRRGQVADYVLNQGTSAETTAARTFLKRSDAARMWVLSLMDSLEHMYEKGSVPEIPEAEAEERPRRRERERAGRDRPRDRERERPSRDREKEREPLRRDRDRDRDRGPRELTPEAEEAVRRRRIAAAIGAVLILGAAITVALVLLIDTEVHEARAPTTKVIGQLLLQPLEGGSDQNQIVQARLRKTGEREAYEVWLYNSDRDAVSLGAQVTDENGNYQGAGRLPAPLERYKFIDVSLEKLDRNTGHSGNSVLRGEIANLQSPQEVQQQQGGATGGQGAQPPPQQPQGP